MSMKIFTSKRCGWAIRNYAALIEKKIKFELVPAKDEYGTFLQEFCDATPIKQTPVLVDSNGSVFDSLLINEYIEENFDGYALMPTNAADRSTARCAMYYCDNVLIKNLIECFNADKDTESQLSKLGDMINEFSERYLQKNNGPYFFGDQFSLVDLAFYNFFSVESYFVEKGVKEADLPSFSISNWKEAIFDRPSILAALEMRDDISF